MLPCDNERERERCGVIHHPDGLIVLSEEMRAGLQPQSEVRLARNLGREVNDMVAKSTLATRKGLQLDSEIETEVERDVSEDDLERIVRQISRLVRTASLEFALRVGALIIHQFYGGDTDSWRLRGPKVASFRRLAEHPGLPMSPGALYRCVAIFELCDRLSAPSRWRNLGASHLRVVLGLDLQTQEQLLSTANAEQWTVRDLQTQVRRAQLTRSTKGGRRPQPTVVRMVRSLRKCMDEHIEALHALDGLDEGQLNETLDVLNRTCVQLEGIRSAIERKRTEPACSPFRADAELTSSPYMS